MNALKRFFRDLTLLYGLLYVALILIIIAQSIAIVKADQPYRPCNDGRVIEGYHCYGPIPQNQPAMGGKALAELSFKENGSQWAIEIREQPIPATPTPVVRHWAKHPCYYNLYWWCKNHTKAPGSDKTESRDTVADAPSIDRGPSPTPPSREERGYTETPSDPNPWNDGNEPHQPSKRDYKDKQKKEMGKRSKGRKDRGGKRGKKGHKRN